jgi:haloacetate dehalogenase
VLLLHGFPQNHVMWRPVMRELAARHTVVATDLRGYGDSDRPPAGEDHYGYSFRAMAADQAGVMAELGFERFAVVGHDRGARVTHRLALDHPDRVEKLALLDILPTAYVYGHVDRALAQAYYHWFFFTQPADLPERLIAGDPIYYLHRLLGSWGSGLAAHDAESLAAYEKAFADPGARHAMLEDYRAGATIDLEHDAEGGLLGAPTLVLWGEKGVVGRNPEPPVEVWRRLAADPALVTGRPIPDAGHFLVEENLPATLSALRDFLAP